jgi:hypothetical protein
MNFILEIKGMDALSHTRPNTVIRQKKYRYVGFVCQPVFTPQIRTATEDVCQHYTSMLIKRIHLDGDLAVSWHDDKMKYKSII